MESLAAEDAKINVQAAALEQVRARLIMAVQQDNMSTGKPLGLVKMRSNLEVYMLRDHFIDIKKEISQAMGSEVSEERAEHYVRNFIIKPSVESEYHSVLNNLKMQVNNSIIKTFPISSLVLDESIRQKLGINTSISYQIVAMGMDMDKSGLCIENIPEIASDLILQISKARETAREYNAYRDMLGSDPSQMLLVLESNCLLLYDFCRKMLEGVIKMYEIDQFQAEDELSILKKNFKNYVHQKILESDDRLAKHSAAVIEKVIESESKLVYKQIKAKINYELSLAKSKDRVTSFEMRSHIKKRNFEEYKNGVKDSVRIKLGTAMKTGFFYKLSYDTVYKKLEEIMDDWNYNQLTTITEECKPIIEQISSYIDITASGEGQWVYRYFLVDNSINIQALLSNSNRLALAQLIILAQKEPVPELATKVIASLDVSDSFSQTHSSQQHTRQPEKWHESLSSMFDSQTFIDIRHMVNLIFGLYFMVMDSDAFITNIVQCVKQQTPIVPRQYSMHRRQLLFRMLREVKNGKFSILNYQIVLIIETALSSYIYRHNDALSFNNKLGIIYSLDYNKSTKQFRDTPVAQLVDVLMRDDSDTSMDVDGQILFRKSAMEFIRRFISDMPSGEGDLSKEYDPTHSQPMNSKHGFMTKMFNKMHIRKDKDSEPELRGEQESKLAAKLKFFKDNLRTFQFENLSADHISRSRTKILCISGFLSQEDDPLKEWSELKKLYPFTEIQSLNWESYGKLKSFTSMIKAMRGISFKSLTSMFYTSLYDSLPGGHHANRYGIFDEKFMQERVNRQEEGDLDNMIGVSNDPFENNHFDAEAEVYMEKPERSIKNFLSLKNIPKIFSKDTWKQVN